MLAGEGQRALCLRDLLLHGRQLDGSPIGHDSEAPALFAKLLLEIVNLFLERPLAAHGFRRPLLPVVAILGERSEALRRVLVSARGNEPEHAEYSDEDGLHC